MISIIETIHSVKMSYSSHMLLSSQVVMFDKIVYF